MSRQIVGLRQNEQGRYEVWFADATETADGIETEAEYQGELVRTDWFTDQWQCDSRLGKATGMENLPIIGEANAIMSVTDAIITMAALKTRGKA